MASGIGGPEGPKPEEIGGLAKTGEGPSGGDVSAALHAKVKTLGELKAVLIRYLGEKQGTKMYNTFIQSFAMIMLSQIQQSAEAAKKAAQQTRMQQG